MLLGDARTWDERGFDIEKTKHCILYGERICDERTANRRGARMEAFGRGKTRKYEECPLMPKRLVGPTSIPWKGASSQNFNSNCRVAACGIGRGIDG